MEVANRRNLFVIRRTGSWGDISAFSFYPTKNLGAIGDAGAVVTDSQDLAEKARLVQEYGWRQRYISEIPGMNTRLDAVQAAVLRVKLEYLDQENEKRRNLARCYRRHLSDQLSLCLPAAAENCQHVYHQFVIRSPSRDGLKDHLETCGVGSLVHYPMPIHRQPAYIGRFFSSNLWNTDRACTEILSLPIMPHLSLGQIEEVSTAISEF